MPTARETVTFDVHDAKIAPLIADLSSGTEPQYDEAIDVPGIAQVSVDPEFITAELKGDARTIARKGKTGSFNFSATYSILSMDVLEVLLGGLITDETGPPETVKYALLGANSLPYFKFSFAIHDGDVPSVHVTGRKCQLTGGSLFDQSTDEFGQRSFQVSAIPCLSDDSLFEVEFFSEHTEIPTLATP